jgi:hypothetical protein
VIKMAIEREKQRLDFELTRFEISRKITHEKIDLLMNANFK